MLRRIIPVLAIVLALFLSISGCGSAPTTEPTTSPEPAPEPSTEPIQVIELGPDDYFVTSLEITPEIAVAGSEVTVRADIRNLTTSRGTCKVALMVDDARVEEREMTLEDGETKALSFSMVKSNGGDYSVAINNMTGSLRVIELEKYTNSKYGHSVSYPSDWTLNADKPSSVVMFTPPMYPMMLVQIAPNDEGKTMEELNEKFLTDSEEEESVTVLSDDKIRTADDLNGFESMFAGELEGVNIKGKVRYTTNGSSIFTLTVITQEEDWGKWEAATDVILESLRLPGPDFVAPTEQEPGEPVLLKHDDGQATGYRSQGPGWGYSVLFQPSSMPFTITKVHLMIGGYAGSENTDAKGTYEIWDENLDLLWSADIAAADLPESPTWMTFNITSLGIKVNGNFRVVFFPNGSEASGGCVIGYDTGETNYGSEVAKTGGILEDWIAAWEEGEYPMMEATTNWMIRAEGY